MTPAFGFSVGDFVNTIHLIRKISKALKEVGGASSEYQDAVIELKGLKHALQHLEALEPTEDNIGHVNAIRGMALACRIPLQEFLVKLEQYELSLGPWAGRHSFRGVGRKTQWAISFRKEVEKVRAVVAAKQISINLLLAVQCSQTLSSFNLRAKQEYSELESKIVEHKFALGQIEKTVGNVEHKMDKFEAVVDTNTKAMVDKMEGINTSVVSLRTLGYQIMEFLKTFPRDIRDVLQNIVQADWRTYQAVLRIQEHLARSPSSLDESNIQFTNGLGEHSSLPYEYFCQWEPFEGFLRAQFKNKPGESKVIDGHFHIMDRNRLTVLRKENWSRAVCQGAQLSMSMVMTHLRRKRGLCPQPSCTGVGERVSGVSGCLTCDTCCLNFFSEYHDLEDSFECVNVSEDDVARRQAEEDLQLYGNRPQPSDAIDIMDNSTEQTEVRPKRNLSEVEPVDDRPAKMRKSEEPGSDAAQRVTAMDWNSGASPLDSWLNQSAIPSQSTTNQEPSRPPEKDFIAQEAEEIKAFRTVHVAMATEVASMTAKHAVDKDFASLALGAQVYYRNIKDRYPNIPSFLARRLAEANLDRAERLQCKRRRTTETSEKHNNFIPLKFLKARLLAQRSDAETKERQRLIESAPSREGAVDHSPVLPEGQICRECQVLYDSTFNSDDGRCPLCRPLEEGIGLASTKSRVWEFPDPHPDPKLQKTDPATVNGIDNHYQWQRGLSSPEGFWHGGRPRRRPSSAASLHSRSSSMNSSLRGSQINIPLQKYDFDAEHENKSSRGLPPPPVTLGKLQAFDCDMCGKSVLIKRRREWQDHVMDDLRPYICTHRVCPQAKTQYGSRINFVDHELQKHEGASLYEEMTHTSQLNAASCSFCQEKFPRSDVSQSARHLGRHMEEIAFAVVPKAYEEWEFYSDSSEGQPAPKDFIYACTFIGCHEQFRNKSDWILHEFNVHGPWKCGEKDVNRTGLCDRVFRYKANFRYHLWSHHPIKNENAIERRYQYDRSEQNQFWCGFCRKMVKLELRGLEGLNEKVNHIDLQHIASGQIMLDWVPEYI